MATNPLPTASSATSVDQAGFAAFIDTLELPDDVKTELKALTPATYIGNASEQARKL